MKSFTLTLTALALFATFDQAITNEGGVLDLNIGNVEVLIGLFIGAMLGGAYGTLMVDLFPGHGLTSSPYAMVGMGAMVAATVRAPMTAILLLFELTASYQVILPVMTACAVATVVARVLDHLGAPHRLAPRWGEDPE